MAARPHIGTHTPLSHRRSVLNSGPATTDVLAFRSSWFIVTDTLEEGGWNGVGQEAKHSGRRVRYRCKRRPTDTHDELTAWCALVGLRPQYLAHAMLEGAEKEETMLRDILCAWCYAVTG